MCLNIFVKVKAQLQKVDAVQKELEELKRIAAYKQDIEELRKNLIKSIVIGIFFIVALLTL